MNRLSRLTAWGAAALTACVPPEKSLEADLRELLDEHELFHRMVFCQTGDGSRTAMCVVERNPSGPDDFLEMFDLVPLGPGQAADSTLLTLWSGSVECRSVGVFAPRYQRAAYRSPPDGDLYETTYSAFEHIVLFDSSLRDQVCLQVRYADGMEPGWR